MKKLILLFVFLNFIIYSQPRHRPDSFPNNQLLIKPTIIAIPDSGNTVSVSYLYRIPFKNLVFEKAGNNYKANVRIIVEVMKEDELVVRNIKDKNITVDNFQITQNKNASAEGVINFNLSADEYDLIGVLNDLNSEKELKLAPAHLKAAEFYEKGIFDPVVINFNENDCDNQNYPLILNQSGNIPFSSPDYQLVIPVADTSTQLLTIEMKNNEDDLVTKTITESYTSGLAIIECTGKMFLGVVVSNHPTKNFILRNFSSKLNEGNVTFNIKKDEENDSIVFPIDVQWIGKPISLRNPEFAIEMIQYIEEDSVVDKMLDADEDDYRDELFHFWQKYDPTPDTKYNELMEEFYSRIDYAALEFKGLAKKNGISTDRGKVYIKYGKPEKVERSSDEYGYVVETWIYANNQQRFVFVDKDGTGNFILIEG